MSEMELELRLKLQDRMSAGMKAALKSLQNESKGLKGHLDGVAKAAGNIKPTGIERMIKSMNALKSATKSTMDMLSKTAQIGTSIAAGGYVVKRALDKPMAYADKLASISNIAYSDRDVTGRIAGQMDLNKAIRNAQAAANGRGNQDELAATLGDLVGSGAMGAGQVGVKSSMNLLATLNKASIGTGADIGDLAKIAMAAKQNMGMSDAEVKQFLSQAITAGNLGGFEIKDMARYLPEQMASYAANGMKGMAGAQDLLAYNQVSRITAGNADQAGNNLVNLLGKVNSVDTQRDFQKQGVDLTGSLALGKSKGIGTLDTFMMLVDKIASKDPMYQALKKKASSQTGDAQKKTIEAMMDLYEQKGIGMTVQDRQAMAALLAARQQKGKLDEVRNAVRSDDGTQIDRNFSVRDANAYAAKDRMANASDRAAFAAEQSGDGVITSMMNGAASLADKFPNLAAAAYSATTALAALAAAGGISTILKGGGKDALGKAATKAGGIGSAAKGAMSGGMLSSLVLGAAPLAAMLGVTNWVDDKSHDKQRVSSLMSLGSALNKLFGSDPDAAQKEWRKKKDAELGIQQVNVTVEVKNGNIVAAVNEKNTRQANRH